MPSSWRWMNSIAPISTPRVGCPTRSTERIALHLPRQHDLLLVAAGEVCRLQPAVRRADVVLFDLLARIVAHRADVEERPSTEAPVAVIAERGVLPFLEAPSPGPCGAGPPAHARAPRRAHERRIGMRHHRHRARRRARPGRRSPAGCRPAPPGAPTARCRRPRRCRRSRRRAPRRRCRRSRRTPLAST